jgi:hypothetical protein
MNLRELRRGDVRRTPLRGTSENAVNPKFADCQYPFYELR